MGRGGDEDGVLAAQVLSGGVGHGGVGIQQVVVGVEHFADGGETGGVVHGVGAEVLPHAAERLGVYTEAAGVGQIGHPLANSLAIAARQFEELALEVGGDENVHRGRGGENELAVGDVVGAGVDEVGEHAVVVAGAQQPFDGRTDLLGVPSGQDVAEVARGNAHVDGASGFDLARSHEFGIAGDVIDHLRQQPPPVDGVGAGKGDAVLVQQLLGELLVGKGVLDAGLAVVESAAHGPHLHVVSGGGDHLLALDVAHAAIGEQHPDGNAVYALETLQGGLAGVAGGGHEDHELVIERSLLAQLLGAGREEVGQALQGHVLEGTRRPVPQLQDVGALVQ